MSERELDQLIDAALPGYLAEPPDGMNQRILARARSLSVWPWVAGIAAAAALAIAALLPRPGAIGSAALPLASHAPASPGVHAAESGTHRSPVTHAPASPGVNTAAAASAPTSALSAERQRRAPQRSLPLTRREHALMQFAQNNPDLVRQVLVEAPVRMAAPLEFQPLAFEPITIEPLASISGGE